MTTKAFIRILPHFVPFFIAGFAAVACGDTNDGAGEAEDTGGSGGRGGSSGNSAAGEGGGEPGKAGRGGSPGGEGGRAAGGEGGTAGTGSAGEGGGGASGEGGTGAGGEAGGGGEGGLPDDGVADASSGRYRLMHKQSGKCVRMAATKALSLADCADDTEQNFYFDPAQTDRIRLRSEAHSSCVTVSDTVAAQKCTAQTELELVQRPGPGARLRDPAGQKCLRAAGDALAAGTCDDGADWEPVPVSANFALAAVYTATSTFGGYSLDFIHDGKRTLGLEGDSWANDWAPPDLTLPQTVSVDLGEPRQFARIDLYTTEGYPMKDFDLDYFDGAEWQNIAQVRDNVSTHVVEEFRTVIARELRVVCISGPAAQTNYVRINELEIY